MEYRIHKKIGDKISEIGIGTAYIFEGGQKAGVEALCCAYEGGINYFDMAAAHEKAFPIFGEAFRDVRRDVFYQVHFGADYSKGEYAWSLDLDVVKQSIDEQLTALRTDYIDYGFIHCLDESKDWETYQANGILDYIKELQKSGVIRHIGASSHTPSVAQRVLDDTEIDMLMFSINPAYDYGEGEFGNGSTGERAELYQRCEREGIGITVMKPFAGGLLLDARSPFGKALTREQCIKYCLDRPGVLSVITGARDRHDVEEILEYHKLQDHEKDYSQIADFAPVDTSGHCVYCNHCSPCPAGLNVGLINKYYDLAKAGDILAAEHYMSLELGAADCTGCGHCDERCPFGVGQSQRMETIRGYFGK